jgi:hypothetical protein
MCVTFNYGQSPIAAGYKACVFNGYIEHIIALHHHKAHAACGIG